MSILKVKDLVKIYKGNILALDSVSFNVAEGEVLGIIGPSGSGKSTLLRCINRMIEPSSGTVRFNGRDMTSLSRSELRTARTRIGMIFQHYNLVNRLTVMENVLHGRLGYKGTISGTLGLYTMDEKRSAREALSRLGLEDQAYKRCDALSGGQKQRVGIARALVQDPSIILCDEPIASLDPGASKVIMDHLRKISRKTGITILVSLHQVDVAIKYSDRIIGINSGKIVHDGDPRDLKKKDIYRIYGSEAGELIID